MKKFLGILFLLILAGGAYVAWQIFGPTVSAPADKYFFVRTGSNYDEVKQALEKQEIISNGFFFEQLARRAAYPKSVRAGRYEIKQGSSLYDLVRMLKQGRQLPIKLVINKLRTKEDLARKVGGLFESDSLEVIRFLSNNDSLRSYGLDSSTVMSSILPDTYLAYWNGSFKKLFSKFIAEKDKFWNADRLAQATAENLSPVQVYTMASIVEEETNKTGDKGLIASVYINRIRKGMKLEADPTVKYAMRDFGLKRILYGHLNYPSPYNTYRNAGLPPGPICTATRETIDAVLTAPETDYIFFVAKPDFSGYSNFASNYADHLKYAKAYQAALDSMISKKQNAATL